MPIQEVLLPTTFSAYLKLEVGGMSSDELLATLEFEDYVVSAWAKDLMKQPGWKPGEKKMVTFACATVRELGFAEPLTMIERVWTRIRDIAHLCESSDGPFILRALGGRARGEQLLIAMEQIMDSAGNPSMFAIRHGGDGRLWLQGSWFYPFGSRLRLDDEIVFRLRA